MKAKCLKALNLLKVLSHTSWGADRTTLLHLYRSLIRSKLDYGSIVYGSARKSYLQMLDTVHNQGLRLALGAFRTSPVSSLNVEADEPSLWLRREKLSLQYAIRLAANPSNTAFEITFPPQFQEYYERKPNAIKSFGLRIAPLLESANINTKNIQKHSFSDIPSWCITKPNILFDLHNSKKSLSDLHLIKQNFQELQSRLSDYQHIYTDGSKVEDKVGCAYISGSHHEMIRLPDGLSIFTAESKAIDMAHNQGLRLALGAFRTSPISSLNVEADEPSLWLRREKLSLQYAIRLAANPSNPAFEVTFPPQFQEYYERKPNAIKSFGLRIAPLLESSNINTKNIQKHSFSDIPSWCITKPTILFDLHNSKKSLSDSHLMKQNFQELQSRLSDYQHIYTDGSKVAEKVGCAYISGSHHEKIRLPDGSSIFTAESKAIDMALDYVMNNSLDNKFVIFSDSLSVLKSLNHTSSKSPKIQNLIEKHHELSKTKEIIFCWLPSHVGIKGNEAADVKAKASLDLEISNFKLPCTDFKPFINRYILSKWQLSWDRATFNKLHEIKPVLGKNTIYRSLRRDEVVLTRLRIGHTRLTHSYLLKREDQPFCISCNEPFTAKHFLIDCIEFSHVRRQFFQTNDLRYLFENVPADNILFFLKHINLFNKV